MSIKYRIVKIISIIRARRNKIKLYIRLKIKE